MVRPMEGIRVGFMTSNDGWVEATSLIGRAVGGDRSAMNRFVQLTQRDVWRFVASHTNAGEADDLTQETYLRVLRTLPRFERRSSLRTWMLVIARRVVIDHLRHQSTRPQVVPTPDWVADADRTAHFPGPEDAASNASQLAHQLLRRLAPDRREAMFLTQLLGMTYEEAAAVCGCPVGTIRSRVARGRDDLVRLMQEDPGTTGIASIPR